MYKEFIAHLSKLWIMAHDSHFAFEGLAKDPLDHRCLPDQYNVGESNFKQREFNVRCGNEEQASYASCAPQTSTPYGRLTLTVSRPSREVEESFGEQMAYHLTRSGNSQ